MDELLRVDNIAKHYYQSQGLFKRTQNTVLRDVSLGITAGESLGLVGESGSGKTTLARCIMGILKPDAGTVRFNGVEIASLKGSDLHAMRRQLSIVYQNPYLSLNPHFTLLELIAEPINAHEKIPGADLKKRVSALLEQVGLSSNLLRKRIGAVRHSCDRVLVMSEGQVVEHGETALLLSNPQHAYTQRLIAATPQLRII